MFYSHDILQRRGGKFGVIWLAATREKTLTKRDFYSVHVEKSCEEILNYITLRKTSAGGSKQRFSLYLSSQLMFGITKIYGKQAEYLLGEARRLHRSFSSLRLMSSVDYFMHDKFQLQKTGSATACTLSEPNMDISLMNPFFGQLGHLLPMEGLFLPEREDFVSMSMIYSSPEQPYMSPEYRLSPNVRDIMEDVGYSLHQVSSMDEITMKEEDPIHPQMQYVGEDLLPPVSSALAEIMEEVPMPPDFSQEQVTTTGPTEISSPGGTKVWTMDESTGKLLLSPGRQPRTSPSHAEKETSPFPSPIHPPQPQTSPVLFSPMIQDAETATEIAAEIPTHPEFKTPAEPTEVAVPILLLAALQDEQSAPLVIRHTRKRKLVFADAKTQLSKDQMRKNMLTADDLTHFDVLANPHPHETALKLFHQPARKAMKYSDALMDHWRFMASRCPSTKTKAYDPKAPAWSTAYLRPPEKLMSSSASDKEATTPERFQPLEISASPERVRAARSRAESETSRTAAAKFEDTPSSLILSDLSRLSESRDASRFPSFSGDQSSLQRSRLRMEEGIEEERLPEQEEIKADEVPPPPLLKEIEDQLAPVQEMEYLVEEGLQVDDHVMDHAIAEHSTSEDDLGDIPQAGLYKQIIDLTEGGQSITFQELVPLTTQKKVAAKILYVLLEYGASRLVTLGQSKPYADIIIRLVRSP